MAITRNIDRSTIGVDHELQRLGTYKMITGDFNLDNSYTTGGYSVNWDGLTDSLKLVMVSAKGGYLFEYDYTNKKLKVLYPTKAQAAHQHQQSITTGSTAAADSTSGALIEDSVAAETAVRAMGTAIDTTYDIGNTVAGGAITAAVAEEVANGADLSGVTGVKYVVIAE